MAATFSIGGNWLFLAFWGDRIEVAFCDQAGNFDSSARLHTSPIPRSTSDCVGAGGINQGIVWQLHF